MDQRSDIGNPSIQDNPSQVSSEGKKKGDTGKQTLQVVETGQEVAKVKKPANPYTFNELQIEEWGDRSMDTAIARAWARMDSKGNAFGPPLGDEKDNDEYITQSFQYARARMPKEDNDNLLVFFYDGKGEIGSESGL